MTKQDRVNRWGVDWEAASKEVEEDFDEKHNVMKRKTESATIPNDVPDHHPWGELDGYPDWLHKHEMLPLHNSKRVRSEVSTYGEESDSWTV